MNAELLPTLQLAWTGQSELARQRIAELWASLAPDDFFDRCVLAHYMADLQLDPPSELRWDHLALEAALAATPESFAGHIPDVTRESFLPSLYLNLAASYERTLEVGEAARYAVLALGAAGSLPATPLGSATRAAIIRLATRLGLDTE